VGPDTWLGQLVGCLTRLRSASFVVCGCLAGVGPVPPTGGRTDHGRTSQLFRHPVSPTVRWLSCLT